METNKATEKFIEGMQVLFADYYSKQHSERVKRGITAKRHRMLSTPKVDVNHCKVL